MQATETAPIACTLDVRAIAERLADIQRLTLSHLGFHRLEGLTLFLAYDRAAAAEVTRLVSLERACCAFLTFNLQVQLDGVEVSITAPEEARDAAQCCLHSSCRGARSGPCRKVAAHAVGRDVRWPVWRFDHERNGVTTSKLV